VTEELEQILRRGYDLWNRRDFEALDELFHPEVEIDATSRVFNPAHFRGIEGFRKLTAETFDTWEEWSVEPTKFLWNGNRVVVETRISARGKGSGIPLVETYYSVWTLEDGRASVMELHVDADRAFQAAGLSRPSDR
jgi:ketosteroid isomerase-like protein